MSDCAIWYFSSEGDRRVTLLQLLEYLFHWLWMLPIKSNSWLSTTNKLPFSVVFHSICRNKTATIVARSNATGAFFFIKNFLTLKSLGALFDFHVSQFCSAIFSSFLLRIHDSKRNTISITMPRPEKASLISFSETWPNACPAERTAPDQSPAATKLKARNVGQVSFDIP